MKYLDTRETGDLIRAIAIAAGGILLSFVNALVFYALGQMLDTMMDIADSNDDILKQTRILTERVEHLPVVSLNSRFGNPPAGDVKKEAAPPVPRPAEHGSTSDKPWKCPECGNINPAEIDKCASCGQTGLWQCPKCGKVNPYSVDECTGCGALDSWICPDCGEINPRKNFSCSNCGRAR